MKNGSENNGRIMAMDYLRGFLTVLVVLHHTILSYTSHGYAALIRDPITWNGFDMITGFLDIFFMPLFFFVSGVFALKSIESKGVSQFLRGRFLRLGVPFIIGWLVINIPAYYLSYGAYMQYIEGVPMSVGAFFEFWMSEIGKATAGPLWFIWVLLLFDCVLALIYKFAPRMCDSIRNAKWLSKPWLFLFTLLGWSVVAYLPMANVGEGVFVQLFGPFSLQVSRVLLYFLFFFVGGMIGVYGIDKSAVRRDSALAKRWWLLLIVGVAAYMLLREMYIAAWMGQLDGWWLSIVLSVLFLIVCVSVSFGLMTAFMRYTNKHNTFMRCLSRNAYGIYIFHYSVVTFWQVVFIMWMMHGLAKGATVFVIALATTWGLVWLLRRNRVVRKVIG